jgi:hypothetical protein
MGRKAPKPKKINFEIIHEQDGKHEPEPYRILREVRDKWHEDIAPAKIALAWRKSYKPDKDGHLILGKCMKASDLQRELVQYDFVILLNREVWMDMDFTVAKKKALLDHELCHAATQTDKLGESKYDERGRNIWRVRKHDIEEFNSVVNHHGCYKRDLEKFAEALLKKREMPLLAEMEKQIPETRPS